MPKISVIIPIYNVEKYLVECLDSVVNQTLKDIEIICIDDGSKDNSLAIIKEYASKDDRIIFKTRENKGVGYTRNEAMNLARGEFVCFMDPDDLYPSEDILELLYTKAIENNVKICGGEFSDFKNGTKEFVQNYKKEFQGYLFEKDGIIDYKDYQFDYGFHRFIYNRELLIKNNIFFPQYIRYEDPVFMVNAMIKAEKFYALHKIAYGYRINHKKNSFNTNGVRDLLKGIYDNLKIAQKYNLENLFNLTCERLCEEYYKKIYHYINGKNREYLKKCIKIAPKIKKIYFYRLKYILVDIFEIKNEYINGYKHKIIKIFGMTFECGKNRNGKE